MSEKRKPEDTVCPTLTAAKIIALAITIPDKDYIKEGEVNCLGTRCHMWQGNDRKCGLRHR